LCTCCRAVERLLKEHEGTLGVYIQKTLSTIIENGGEPYENYHKLILQVCSCRVAVFFSCGEDMAVSRPNVALRRCGIGAPSSPPAAIADIASFIISAGERG
jgi:hypothetical protein